MCLFRCASTNTAADDEEDEELLSRLLESFYCAQNCNQTCSFLHPNDLVTGKHKTLMYTQTNSGGGNGFADSNGFFFGSDDTKSTVETSYLHLHMQPTTDAHQQAINSRESMLLVRSIQFSFATRQSVSSF